MLFRFCSVLGRYRTRMGWRSGQGVSNHRAAFVRQVLCQRLADNFHREYSRGGNRSFEGLVWCLLKKETRFFIYKSVT